MKYWLKYGLYGIIVGLLIFLIGIPINLLGIQQDCIKNLDGVCSTGFLSLFGAFAIKLFTWPFRFFKESLILQLILWTLPLFIIGVIIGLIIGLFQKKKK